MQKKNISTCCCPDKICEFLPAAGRCNRHTKRAKHGLWSGQGDSQMERTGCWQSRDVPEPSSDQAESTWVSLKPLLGVQNTGHAAAEAPLSGVHLPTCTYPILTGKSSPKEKLPPNLERLPFRRMANATPAQQLWTGIHIPDKGCLLLESYCKVVIQTHNWNTIYLYSIKTGTKALTWSTKSNSKQTPCFHACSNLKKVQQAKKQKHLPVIQNLTV